MHFYFASWGKITTGAILPLAKYDWLTAKSEPRNNRTLVIDTNNSTMFTLLLDLNIICERRWIQFKMQYSPSRVLHLMAKYTLPFSKRVILDRKITLKQQIFSVRSSRDSPIKKKLLSDPVLIRQNWLQSWSSRIPSWSVLISGLKTWSSSGLPDCLF